MSVSSETPATHSRENASPWRGKLLLVVGIVLLGITLRYAVTGFSPLLPVVSEALGLGTAQATLLGMLPTMMFGVGGLLAPLLVRKSSTEMVAVLAMAFAALGAIGRSMAGSPGLFMALSALALLGMGFGNVVGAPLVKKYFADKQQAAMLTTFALLMQAGATLPAMTAVPLANAGGWRFSLASWGFLSILAILPWAIQLFKMRGEKKDKNYPSAKKTTLSALQLLKSPVAVGTGIFYAMASFNTYATLAWLPTILGDGGQTVEGAAGLFSIYTFMTLPMALLVPLAASKMKQPFPLAGALALVHMVGYLGLLFAPQLAVVWVVIMGLGGGAFPLAITMFNRRTDSEDGSAALSGFAMGTGYLVGTLGPLLGGWLNSATGGWTLPILIYAASGILMLAGAFMMTREHTVEEQVAQSA